MSSVDRIRITLGRLVAVATVSLGCRATVATEPTPRPAAAPSVPNAALAGAAAPSGSPPGGPLDDTDRARGIVWRFHAGAPLDGGPAVGPGGEVYVGSVEGYLHALSPEGAFQWSYTVKGGIIGAPVVGPDGRVFVATTTRQIYAILPSGRRAWTFSSPVAIVTPLAEAREGSLVFGGADRHVWAVSSRAGARWRAELSGRVAAGPAAGPRGFPAVAVTSDGTVSSLNGSWSRWDTPLGGAPRGEPVVLADGSVWVAVGHRAVLLDAKGHLRFERPGVERVALDGERLVAVSGTALSWLDRAGQELGSVDVGSRPSATPLVLHAELLVPCEDGRLRRVSSAGVVGALRVSGAPLYAPRPAAGHVVVAAGDGTVVMCDPGRIVGER